jgi:DNA modification methylase
VNDPFCGSGSTLLAAHQLNRIGYGVEIDPGYVAVTLELTHILTGQARSDLAEVYALW